MLTSFTQFFLKLPSLLAKTFLMASRKKEKERKGEEREGKGRQGKEKGGREGGSKEGPIL